VKTPEQLRRELEHARSRNPPADRDIRKRPKKVKPPKPKAVCPITLGQFVRDGRPTLVVIIDGVPMEAVIKEFSSGSFGWHAVGKITLTVGGVACLAQVGVNITLIGSGDAPR
jgi:hypothetical protein